MAKRSLEERIQRLEDIHEIENLMGRHEYLHTAALNAEDAELFAKKTPGVGIEIADWGVYEGTEAIKRFHLEVLQYAAKDAAGILAIHTLSTPVIEVAGDGKTAKAVWISPGLETMPDAEGRLTAYWVWAKYGVDFVKEDGQWKFWHLHLYSLFACPYDKSWVEAPEHPALQPLPDELKPDRPTTYHQEYSPKRAPEYVPAPPEPYESWDDSMSYIKSGT
jgi:hypothetical protein